MARPKTDIDWKRVDELLEADCEGTEIAAHLGIVPNTLYERCKKDNNLSFSEYLQQKKAKGNSLLKEEQYKMATSNEDSAIKKSMLIWLGKQRLGQSDRSKQQLDIHTEKNVFNITFQDEPQADETTEV